MSAKVEVEYPKRLWLYRGWRWGWRVFGRGSDEFGQHTFYFGIPWVVVVVVAYRICSREGECADMADFACEFPGCRYSGMSGQSPCYCLTHDAELYADWIAEEAARSGDRA